MQQSSKTSVAEGAAVRPAQCARVQARRTVQVSAKYGEGSKYFDLKDMENTTGSWDRYDQDSPKRYPEIQASFFTLAADSLLGRRGALRGFPIAHGVGAIATFGLKGAADADLPTTKGPQTSGENGKGGSVKARL